MDEEIREPNDKLTRCRRWFQAAVDGGQKWREEAKEDYEFTAGKQWKDEEIQAFREDGRPAITINRIKPLLNILSGYQRINRYDLEFLARTSDDVELCQVRRGMTKYVMDRCDYDSVESQVFLDCAIGGLGWFNVRYKFDHEIQDGEALIERVDPFSIYIDPEAYELDFSDAKYLIRAKWVSKEELKQVYPEKAAAIEANYSVYDPIEKETHDERRNIPQREVNKRRIQELHLLNTSANGGGWIEEGAMTPEQESEFKRLNNVPGHFNKVVAGALGLGRIREREPKNPPAAIIQAEQQATEDLKNISGINESLLGVEVPTHASGRAIELRQKQAVTHLAVIFDSLRRAKKKIANLLWGRRGHAGLIPQFYTAEKTYRIEGENGQEFVSVNQQVIEQDPVAGVIVKTLNDLSQGEFDIVVTDVESSTTQRQAQIWALVDAVTKLNVPADLIFDAIIDLSDLPNKNNIKARWQQRQEEQKQAQERQTQAQIQIEEIKNRDFRQTIAFKDAPLPIQMAMAAKAGYVSQEVADYFMQVMIEQMAPQLARQMQPPQMPQLLPDEMQLAQLQQQLAPSEPQNQPQPRTMTQAAAESVMRGIAPAAM